MARWFHLIRNCFHRYCLLCFLVVVGVHFVFDGTAWGTCARVHKNYRPTRHHINRSWKWRGEISGIPVKPTFHKCKRSVPEPTRQNETTQKQFRTGKNKEPVDERNSATNNWNTVLLLTVAHWTKVNSDNNEMHFPFIFKRIHLVCSLRPSISTKKKRGESFITIHTWSLFTGLFITMFWWFYRIL